MKHIYKISASLIACFVLFFSLNLSAYAAGGTITALNAVGGTNSISVSGSTDTAVAIAVMVYDSTGTNLISMVTTGVDSSNNFSTSVTVSAGEYVVKAADYDGGPINTFPSTVVVSAPATPPVAPPATTPDGGRKSPKTGEDISYSGMAMWMLAGVMSAGLAMLVFVRVISANKKSSY